MRLPLNIALMSHPANWVIVTTMALLGAMALDLLTKKEVE